MAWLGPATTSTQRANTFLRGTAGQVGRAPDGCLHGHCGKATSAVWRHRGGQRQTNDTVRCDAEGMTEQADILRASSQGKSAINIVRGRWRCEHWTRCAYGQSEVGQGSVA